jgi:hypothetical protein
MNKIEVINFPILDSGRLCKEQCDHYFRSVRHFSAALAVNNPTAIAITLPHQLNVNFSISGESCPYAKLQAIMSGSFSLQTGTASLGVKQLALI